jgi:hypothetical protein
VRRRNGGFPCRIWAPTVRRDKINRRNCLKRSFVRVRVGCSQSAMSVLTQNVFRPVPAIIEKVGHFSASRPNSRGQRNPQPVVRVMHRQVNQTAFFLANAAGKPRRHLGRHYHAPGLKPCGPIRVRSAIADPLNRVPPSGFVPSGLSDGSRPVYRASVQIAIPLSPKGDSFSRRNL